ncbi:hypothetical protein F443_18761 [Phytophthora nicotianae P1569]|uniref:Uncharacterized protein n=1 Tax=Phytophthora nicotianae P1569 TaxID=1317065 RepID=V9E969_PHYNI|nr:hypothetical protein F443_18761 [Phytophthora nicotianae P1569]
MVAACGCSWTHEARETVAQRSWGERVAAHRFLRATCEPATKFRFEVSRGVEIELGRCGNLKAQEIQRFGDRNRSGRIIPANNLNLLSNKPVNMRICGLVLARHHCD